MTHRRRPHTRSRNGCLMCKKRHMKCDERGPPCSNCEVKNNPCIYPQAGERRNKLSSASRDFVAARSSSLESLAQPTTTHALFPSSSSSPGILSTSPRSIPLDRHLLALELMHRWCTSTARSLCSNDAEFELFLVTAPREARKHDFLLNQLLALASLDLATNQKEAESSLYVNVALEHYHKASASVRPDLSPANPESTTALVLSNILSAVLAIALPQHICAGGTSLENVITMFTMISSASNLLKAQLPEGPTPMEPLVKPARSPYAGTDPPPLDALDGSSISSVSSVTSSTSSSSTSSSSSSNNATTSILSALRRLDFINDDYYSLSRPSPTSRPLQWKAIATHSACRRAISTLGKACMQRLGPERTGFAIGWPGLVEHDFASALKESNPIALMILMHWGALVEREWKNYWWAAAMGQALVAELSDLLRYDASPVWQDAVAWARCHAGLPMNSNLHADFVHLAAAIPDLSNELFFGLEFL